MNSDNLSWFVLSYALFVIAMVFAAIDLSIISGVLVGLSVYFRSMVDSSSEPVPAATYLIQQMPKWKWFSVIYLFALMVWMLKNMNSEYLQKINPVFAMVILFFPFIVPYALYEYKLYKQLKSKKT